MWSIVHKSIKETIIHITVQYYYPVPVPGTVLPVLYSVRRCGEKIQREIKTKRSKKIHFFLPSMESIPRVRFTQGQGLSFSQPTHYTEGADGFVMTQDITSRKPSSPKLGLTEAEARQLHQVQGMNAEMQAAKKKKLREVLSRRVSDAIEVRGGRRGGSEDALSGESSILVEEVQLARQQAVFRAALASKKRRDRDQRASRSKMAGTGGYGGRGSGKQRGNSVRTGRRDLSGRSNGRR